MGNITKLACNRVDDLNHHFLQYSKSSIITAKKLKSISIHGYSRCFLFFHEWVVLCKTYLTSILLEYFISIYIMDLICMKTYRIYEIFKCKIPTSYTDRWLLAKIARIGIYLFTRYTNAFHFYYLL